MPSPPVWSPVHHAMQLSVVLEAVNFSRYLAFASVTIAIYDWILLLQDEVELLGGTRLSLGKVLFYLTRIITIPGLIYGTYTFSPLRPHLDQNYDISNKVIIELTYDLSCLTFLWLLPILCLSSIFISYWLLTLRIIALYQKHPFVKSVLYFSLGACYLTAFGILLSCQYDSSRMATYASLADLCIPAGLSSRVQIVFEAPLVFEGIMFTALIYRAWVDFKFQGSMSKLPLLRIVYRDGILSFAIMTAIRIWNIYKTAKRPAYEAFEGLYIMWSIVSVLSCRTYINIVRAARTVQQENRGSEECSLPGQDGYSLWDLTLSRRLDSDVHIPEEVTSSLGRSLDLVS